MTRNWDDYDGGNGKTCIKRASAAHPMTLILLERLDIGSNHRQAKPLWLVWIGENSPQLEEVWQQYLRRFAIDHWYRLAKQTLSWTLPQLSTPQQCDCWSALMPLLTTAVVVG